MITNMTLTHRIPGEHRQATHTSTRHTCTPLATQARRHRCGKQHLLLLGFRTPPPDLCLQHHTPLSSLSVWSGIAVTLRSKSRGAQKKPRLILKSSLQPQVASLTAQSWGSAEERREVDRHGLNSAACLFQICTGKQRTEAYGFGGPEDKTFPEGPPFWEGQSLGKDAWGGRGRIYGISPPAGNKGRFLRPA